MRLNYFSREIGLYAVSMILLLAVAIWLLISNYKISANLYSKNILKSSQNIELLTKDFKQQLDRQIEIIKKLTENRQFSSLIKRVLSEGKKVDEQQLQTILKELRYGSRIADVALVRAVTVIDVTGRTVIKLGRSFQEISVFYPIISDGIKVGQLVVQLALPEVFDAFFLKHLDSKMFFNLFYGGSKIHSSEESLDSDKVIAEQFTWKFDVLPFEMQWLFIAGRLMDYKAWRYGIVLFVIIFVGAIAGIVGMRNLQHKRFHSSVTETEDAYLKIFYKSRQAMMILNDREVVDCNASALEMFNASNKAELMSLDLLQLSARVQSSGDSSVIVLDEQLNKLYSKGDDRFEWDFRRLGGDQFLAYVNAALIPFRGKKQLILRIKDMTIEKAMEAALEEHEKFTDVIFESMPVGIVLVDAESEEIIKMNKAFAQLMEDRKRRVEGSFLSDYFEGIDISSMYQRCRDNEMIQREVVFENHNLVVTFLMIQMRNKPFFLISFIDLLK